MTALPIGKLAQRNVDVERPPGAAPPANPSRGSRAYARPTRSPATTWASATTPSPTSSSARRGRLAVHRRGRRPERPQPFDLPGLAVVSSPDTLVIGDAARGDAARIPVRWATRRTTGSRRSGARPSRRSSSRRARSTRSRPSSVRAAARASTRSRAVTDGPLLRDTPAQSDRVYLNPDAFNGLSSTGRQRRRHPRAHPRDGPGHDGAQRADLALGGFRRRRRARDDRAAGPVRRGRPPRPGARGQAVRASCPTRRRSTPPRARSRRPTARPGWRCRGCGSGSARTRSSPSTGRWPDPRRASPA